MTPFSRLSTVVHRALPAALWLAASLTGLTATILTTPLRPPNPPIPKGIPESGILGGALFSGDGQFLYFSASTKHLVTNDSPGASLDLFQRNLTKGAIRRLTLGTNESNVALAATTDGSRVLLRTESEGDSGPRFRLALLDVTTGNSVPANSLALASDSASDGPQADGLMTPDGRFVVFQTIANGIIADDTNSAADLYLWDTHSGVRRRLTQQPVDRRGGPPKLVGLSDAGRILAYTLAVTNPLPANLNRMETDLVVADLVAGTERRLVAPLLSNTPLTSQPTLNQSLSRDGRYVAARVGRLGATPATGSELVTNGGILWWDLTVEDPTTVEIGTFSAALTRIGYDGTGPILTGDGRKLTYKLLNPPGSTNLSDPSRVRVWTPETGSKSLNDWVVSVPPAKDRFEPVRADELAWTDDGESLIFSGSISDNPTNRSLYRRVLATGETTLISRNLSGGPSEIQAGFPVVTSDGKWVAFNSGAAELSADKPGPAPGLFLEEISTGALVAAATPLPGLNRPPSDGRQILSPHGLSEDGQRVVFTSYSPTWATNDINTHSDVFLHDRTTGLTSLVSVGTNGFSGAGNSFAPILSADGNAVVFFSVAPGLTPGTNGTAAQAYHHNLQTGHTRRINRNFDSEDGSNFEISSVSMSDDGRWVVFAAPTKSGSVQPDANSNPATYLFDAETGTIQVLNANTPGFSPTVAISGSGKIIASCNNIQILLYHRGESTAFRSIPVTGFSRLRLSREGDLLVSARSGFGPGSILVYETLNNTAPIQVFTNSRPVSLFEVELTRDGHQVYFVVSERLPGHLSDSLTLRVAAVDGSSSEVIFTQPDSGLNPTVHRREPSASLDGRILAFRTTTAMTSNSPAGDHLYVRDRQLGVTYLVDPDADPYARAIAPQVSADGRILVFSSRSPLAPDDLNDNPDLFFAQWLDNEGLVVSRILRRAEGNSSWLQAQLLSPRSAELHIFSRPNLGSAWQPVGNRPLISGQNTVVEFPIQSNIDSEFFKLELQP